MKMSEDKNLQRRWGRRDWRRMRKTSQSAFWKPSKANVSRRRVIN